MWLTEYGYGLDPDDDCMLPALLYGSLHGAFHLGRILEAINTPDAFAVLTFERFVFADPPTTNQPNDWCGMSAGTVAQGHPNSPQKARVTGMGQIVSHVFATALGMATMHPIKISHNPLSPTLILGEQQPCLQGAAFQSATRETTAFVVLNICNVAIAVTLDDGSFQEGSRAMLDKPLAATIYNLQDRGGKAALPSNPDVFPWAEPLHAATASVTSSIYTSPPLTLAVIA
jgi:hypothetical protein